ncbi:MAG TPA: hypothetical protein VKU92_03710, partial [Acidimicrobiales bacterium]|nr:hypothetical protein [Acidimicrobiales bacterium]
CNITKCCTEVCPEHIHITDNAIIPLKERVVDSRYDPVAFLGRKILRRPAPMTADEVAARTRTARHGTASRGNGAPGATGADGAHEPGPAGG